jgi:hypothetical protein
MAALFDTTPHPVMARHGDGFAGRREPAPHRACAGLRLTPTRGLPSLHIKGATYM